MILFVSGPYRADMPEGVHDNIQAARKVAIAIWEAGHTALCPHLNTARFELDCKAPDQAYLDGDLEMLKRCDGIVMMPGWVKSKGACSEYDYARLNGIQLYMFDGGELVSVHGI